jgi:predicted nucleic acid-binding Zn ribbon protein
MTYESSCITPECPEFDKVVEWFARSFDSPELDCPACGYPMERRVSRFGIVWTGPITSKYLDRSVEGGHGDGSHWVWRRNGTKSGKPEPQLITTFQEQREYAKAEGLGLPQDCSPGRISPNGRDFIPIAESEAKDMREANSQEVLKEKSDQAANV